MPLPWQVELADAPLVARFDAWLRSLLSGAIAALIAGGERSEEVWLAALGCMLQLCRSGGVLCRGRLRGLALEDIAAAARPAMHEALFAGFVRLFEPLPPLPPAAPAPAPAATAR